MYLEDLKSFPRIYLNDNLSRKEPSQSEDKPTSLKLTIFLTTIEYFPPPHPLTTFTDALPLWWVRPYGALCPHYRQASRRFSGLDPT